ncbi:hypothetical protein M427DRAFT_160126 [Gonapodya prolifera JEL478]|uniref:BZIP domain-containing protein n=1 Tax=Gonapodya prolifera (strain JEL478) TaxID=1344416 RepID=A0A138ZZG1_GONPJ|nr:hypothetical protein M427DRAFT_160126 [Gonapodya prolifera JEL478]|eukprot:KXS09881.1 hypothetical protein M427DRAFT_160126 [Gonapodya prolifera JEL478]
MDVQSPLVGNEHCEPKHPNFENTTASPSDPSIVLHKYAEGATSATPPKLPSFSSVAAFVPNVYQRPQTGPWGAVPTFPPSSSQIASARASSASRMFFDQNANTSTGNIVQAQASASPDPISPLEPVPLDRIGSQDSSYFTRPTPVLRKDSVHDVSSASPENRTGSRKITIPPRNVESTKPQVAASPLDTAPLPSEPILISSSSDSSDSPASGYPVRASRRHTHPSHRVVPQPSNRDSEEKKVALAAAAAAAAAAMEKGASVGLVGVVSQPNTPAGNGYGSNGARSTASSSTGGNGSSGYASGTSENGYGSNGHRSNGSGSGHSGVNGSTPVTRLNLYVPVTLPAKRSLSPAESPPDRGVQPVTPGHNRHQQSGIHQSQHHNPPNPPYFPAPPFSGYTTDSTQDSFMGEAGQALPVSPNGSHPASHHVPVSPGSASGLENPSGYFAGAAASASGGSGFGSASGATANFRATSTPYDRFSMPLPPSLEAPLSKHAQRAQQNRIAQRAYRERKAHYVRDLEARAQEATTLRKKVEEFEMEMSRLRGLVRVVVAENERLRSGESPEDVPRSVDPSSLDRLGTSENFIGTGDQLHYEASLSTTVTSSSATAAEALHQMYHYGMRFENSTEASSAQDGDRYSDGAMAGHGNGSLHNRWAPQKLYSHSPDAGNDSPAGGSNSSGSDGDKGQAPPYGGRFADPGGFDERREPGVHGHGGHGHSYSHGHGAVRSDNRRAARKGSESSSEQSGESHDSAMTSEERSSDDPPAEQERARSASGSGNESGPSSSGSGLAWSHGTSDESRNGNRSADGSGSTGSTAVDNEGDIAMDDGMDPKANFLHQIAAVNSVDKKWLRIVLS